MNAASSSIKYSDRVLAQYAEHGSHPLDKRIPLHKINKSYPSIQKKMQLGGGPNSTQRRRSAFAPPEGWDPNAGVLGSAVHTYQAVASSSSTENVACTHTMSHEDATDQMLGDFLGDLPRGQLETHVGQRTQNFS